MFMLLNAVRSAGRLLVEVKRKELKAQMRQKDRKKKQKGQ